MPASLRSLSSLILACVIGCGSNTTVEAPPLAPGPQTNTPDTETPASSDIAEATPDTADQPLPPPISDQAFRDAASDAEPQVGASEDDMLSQAIEESKRDQKKQELKGQIADSGPLKDPEEIETIRENTRTLRQLCSDERVDASILESLLECCRRRTSLCRFSASRF